MQKLSKNGFNDFYILIYIRNIFFCIFVDWKNKKKILLIT